MTLLTDYYFVVILGCLFGIVVCTSPNVIIILADDLGYGDLGWSPFNSDLTKNIQAPNLKAMAKNGLFPWRFGVDFIYAGDLKLDGSEEMDHEQLPLIPNIAMSFRDGGYYTAHIGKWHLGGQSHIDIPNRQSSSCSVPGINQYGFDEYVGMSEGTNSMRYWTHQRKETYHAGSKHLFRNDVALKAREKNEILTDRQAEEAMRVISEQTTAGRPFFLNLWFDAPHSPWEPIEPYFSQYQGKFNTEMLQKYASMVTNMDMNIGRLLKHLDDLGIANNTIVVFTSDNGPENEAGSPGPFKGRKRLLSEGGIRVPTIVQWKGRIPAGSSSDLFMLTTDLWPTLTEAAGVPMPQHTRIDGVSLLPRLLSPTTTRGLQYGDERTVLWYTHSIGFPKLSAAWSHGFKLLWNDYEGRKSKNMPAPFRLFDMRRDPTENVDLLPLVASVEECSAYKSSVGARQKWPMTWQNISRGHTATSGQGPTGEFKQAALHLVNHMHTKMHLFRHEGELDWTRYHVNKPYETAPHCGIRRSLEVDSFPFSNSLQVAPPEFCGSSVHQQYSGVSCRCTAQQCDNLWTLGSVGSGNKQYRLGQRIPDGISYLSPESGSLASYTRTELLKWTDFQSRCGDSLPESPQVEHIPSPVCQVHMDSDVFLKLDGGRKTSCKGFSSEWAMGDVVQQHSWQRSCHQRVALDSSTNSSIYLQPNNCGYDFPVLTISPHGMTPTFLSLCSESLIKFMGRRSDKLMSLPHQRHLTTSNEDHSYMDDNVMMVAVNMQLLHESSPVHSGMGTSGKDELEDREPTTQVVAGTGTKTSSPWVPTGFVKNVAVVDPLFFHYLGLEKHSHATLQSSPSAFKMKVLVKGVKKAVNQLWGFIAPFERRLNNTATGDHKLDSLVFPIYHEMVWSVAVLVNLRSSQPSIVYYDPTALSDESVMSNAVRHVLSAVIERSTRSTEALLLPITVLASTTKTKECPDYESSGLKVLLFLKNLKEILRTSKDGTLSSKSLSADVLLSNVNNHYVESERKALIQYFLTQSKRDYARRKKYLKNMSSKKMLSK